MILDLLTFLTDTLSPIVVHTLELIGIFIIAYGSIKSFLYLLKSRFDFNNSLVKLTLGEALALSLEFKLGAEIIKTVLVRDFQELVILVIVVILRVVLTFLIHWELQQVDLETEKAKIINK
ncbi:DUF1622 domain-containing protein [Hutsoniella sourekii]|uniref:DUF1622 domain-containing protein n=1 Tax=Hutsoniella sourekii TaxID=87650 RepID=UPI0004B78C97|nr:DUF1622 domain-containing protein [Hutsoniella sourekii]